MVFDEARLTTSSVGALTLNAEVWFVMLNDPEMRAWWQRTQLLVCCEG